jgi:glutaredoxin
MSKAILFSLENCVKCTQTKELLLERDDVEIVTFPHDLNSWSDDNLVLAKSHDVLEDLQKTAPVLWLNGEKKIGFLRIKKWIQDSK